MNFLGCRHEHTVFLWLRAVGEGPTRAAEWCSECGSLRYHTMGKSPPSEWRAPTSLIRRLLGLS
jgi:hypothetical protein